ncbi:MAG: 5-formyltetrahydrofolate cyclo-ligase [Duncaniella sp.]|uniref:5-formyltetrahydrofolate cyclo-ligase n=1 Tax=Duncaniella sp. TaxID=2518496 RepID=UPI0023C0447B|nr:5-formyltetrahydrofolate cyclo-ligase [Duncaniella sp.]MDE6089426.1 5-formyltetrahydrofolate cyclo-ligase [Duncaniella sp.]
MKKDDIRRHVKARKTLLSEEEKLSAAERVFGLLEKTADFILSDRILMYHSLPDELSTRAFIRKWSGRKHFYLPRVNGVNLEILPYDESQLALGSFHIEEPTGNDTTAITDMEMIVIPAVAYDRAGNRVGRGKGYYDRLLTDSRARKIGVAYDFQLMDEIDAEPHDVRVDVVITENHHIIIRKR